MRAGALGYAAVVVSALLSCDLGVNAQRPGQPVAALSEQTPAGQPLGRDWLVAQRVDDTHIVVLSGGSDQLHIPQRQLEASLGAVSTRAAQPGRIFDLPADKTPTIVAGEAHVGDRWILDTGRGGRFGVRVERFVLAHKDCDEAWGVVGVVAPGDAARFKAVKEDYYVARLQRADDRLAGSPQVGSIAVSLSRDQSAALEALLESERLRTMPDVLDDPTRIERPPQTPRGLRLAERWRPLDDGIQRGQGRLTYNFDAFRLTPDGEPRLFVRARWNVGSLLAYATTAWVRVSATMTLEQSDATAARWMRMGEFEGRDFADDQLGLVLNVFDLDGDGTAEVLFRVRAYESQSIDLFTYPTPGRPRTVLTTYEDGC